MNASMDGPRGRGLRRAGIAAVALVAAASLFAGFSTAQDRAAAPAAPAAPVAAPGFGDSFADVVEAVSPAVVNIAVTQRVRATAAPGRERMPAPFDEFFGRYFERPGMPGEMPGYGGERTRAGAGSGFIVDGRGYIATNQHVIDGADEVVVTLHSGEELVAAVVGQDDRTDVALLKVDASDLPAVRFGDSDSARVGDWVIAIGNPFGLGGTATAGIISARGRDIRSGAYDDYLQIDAPINAGNSGGPVFNAQGEVIGINTAIYSPNGGNIGIGFAIPANQARDIVDELMADGAVSRGWLGVQIQSLDEGLVAALGLDDASGALIADVVANGPAALAGLEVGDVVTAIDGQPVDSSRDLGRRIGALDPGQDVSVEIVREGRAREVEVTLGDFSGRQARAGAAPERRSPDASGRGFGLTLGDLGDAERRRLGLDAGMRGALVVGVEPRSAAAAKGIRPGDVIVSVNRAPVESAEDAVDALGAVRDGDGSALVLLRRGDAQHFVAIQPS